MVKQRYFEQANKPSKLLSWQIKKKQRESLIDRLRIDGEIVDKLNQIKLKFVNYFEQLYKDGEEKEAEIEEFLRKSFSRNRIRKLREEEIRELNQPIGKEELLNAIKNGKSPGSDGLPAIYYKKLEEQLSDVLLKIMNEVLKGGSIPNSWRSAYITLIPKDLENKESLGNYRPISLLNSDYKLFADVLAQRLKLLLNNIIKGDQAGFLPGRRMSYNIRTVVNLIEYLDQNPGKEAAFILVDAEKAFDRVSCVFMRKIIDILGLGKEFENAIRAIYSSQTANLRFIKM